MPHGPAAGSRNCRSCARTARPASVPHLAAPAPRDHDGGIRVATRCASRLVVTGTLASSGRRQRRQHPVEVQRHQRRRCRTPPAPWYSGSDVALRAQRRSPPTHVRRTRGLSTISGRPGCRRPMVKTFCPSTTWRIGAHRVACSASGMSMARASATVTPRGRRGSPARPRPAPAPRRKRAQHHTPRRRRVPPRTPWPQVLPSCSELTTKVRHPVQRHQAGRLGARGV